MEHVDGLRDRKDGRKFAGELLKEKLISHVVNKITFTEQCYYILGEECAGLFLGFEFILFCSTEANMDMLLPNC